MNQSEKSPSREYFIGERRQKLQPDGFFILPQEFLDRSSGEIIAFTISDEPFIYLYDREILDKALERASQTVDPREFEELMTDIGDSQQLLTIEANPKRAQKLVQLPDEMLNRVGIKTEITLLGVNDHFEIVDPEAWQKYQDENPPEEYIHQLDL